MISVSGKIWKEKKVNKNLVEKFKQDYGLGDILSKLIISRNYDTSEIYGIKNSQKLINIFNDNYDFKKASSILLDAIKKNENNRYKKNIIFILLAILLFDLLILIFNY